MEALSKEKNPTELRKHPTPALLPGKSHGWRSLVGCSPWGRKESDTTEWLHFQFSLSCTGEGNGNHSSVPACRIPGMGELGGLPSTGSHRVGHDWSDLSAAAASQKRYFTLWKCSAHLFYWRQINITKSAGLTVRTIYFEWTEGRNQLFYHLEVTSGLEQRSVPWSPWAKSSFPPAFVNKVLLELSHTHSFRYYLWPHLCYDELSSYKRDHMLQKVKIFTVWSFAEKICWPWSKGVWRLMSISNIT